MNKYIVFVIATAMATVFVGCNGNTQKNANENVDSVTVSVPDTALYGVIGEGTTMNVLEVITDGGKTLTFEIDGQDEDAIQGGVFAGDKVTLTFTEDKDVRMVDKMVNLTSLLGKWTSLDRNFQIQENGVIESNGSAESHPYTQWAMSNAQLILNTDTFDVLTLGPDSMTIENAHGIFVYKRQK